MRVHVAIVDDHAVVRQGTRNLLDGHPTIEVVADTGEPDDILPVVRQSGADVVLLDIHLPGGHSGLNFIAPIKAINSDLKVLLFTANVEVPYIRKAMSLHADGYLSKTVSAEELQSAILKVVSATAPVFSADIAERMAEQTPRDVTALTPREEEIVIHVAQGMTNQAIAKVLCVSVKTVDTHVARIMKKWNVNNRTQLASIAYESGLV